MNKIRIIKFPKILDSRGNLSFIESDKHIPFKINRAYWVYDVPGGEIRGGHAFRKSCELIVALSGSFDVIINDGLSEKKFNLNRSYFGLYVPEMNWRKLENFSTNSLAMMLCSTTYNDNDYIYDFGKYISEKK